MQNLSIFTCNNAENLQDKLNDIIIIIIIHKIGHESLSEYLSLS